MNTLGEGVNFEVRMFFRVNVKGRISVKVGEVVEDMIKEFVNPLVLMSHV
jgi:hypothetical protein